jgi:hypothetical protein
MDPELNQEPTEELPVEQVVEEPTLAKEMYKLLIDGEEEEVDLDTLKKMASHGKGADKRMTEAQKLKQDAERLLAILGQDPIAVKRELNKDFDEKKFLTERISQLLEEEMLTPEERQAKEDAEELRAYREAKKKEAEEINNKNLQDSMQVEIQKLDVEFADAFEQTGLPKTNEARRRLATMMLEAVENGQQIPTLTLAKQVKKEMMEELSAILAVSDDQAFEDLLGSELLTKAQKLSLKKVKQPGNRTEPRTTPRDPPPGDKPQRKTTAEFLREQGFF